MEATLRVVVARYSGPSSCLVRRLTGQQKSRSVVVPAVPAVERRITRNRRIEITNGPRQAVFMTTELLEHIFMHLPLKELSVAQGACRRFREVVTTSAKLQQKLFLRPSALGLTEKWTMFVVENPEKEDGLELIRLHGNGTIPTTAILNPRSPGTSLACTARLLS